MTPHIGTKGYLLYDLCTNKFLVSKNVCFYELCYHFSTSNDHLPLPPPYIINHDPTDLEPIASAASPPIQPQDDPPHDHPPTPTLPQPTPLRRSTQPTKQPSYLHNYHCNLLKSDQSSYPTPQASFPISSVLSYDNCNAAYKFFCLSLSSIPEPTTFNQATKHACWLQAMQTELKALEDTNTCTKRA
ncbi:uncharacterized protein LOC127123132 [Lathyrus oleraceus]|uniref:uncharacterized protein LOC127123132 n=1 Tax=Pisum sativum TaxID=3888 RepID=UPI0021D29814|nr:uncharacterized protein LOC127123132 [Pisum sativum]